MFKEFDIRREVVLNASPDTVFEAVSVGTGGWMFPKEEVPDVGGTGADDPSVTAWQPGEHLAIHIEAPNGLFNSLDYELSGAGDRTVLRYRHRSCFPEAQWDTGFAMCDSHTDFYMHTLGEYVEHFPGADAAYTSVNGPEKSTDAGALDTVRQALGLSRDTQVGAAVLLDVPGVGAVDAVLDLQNDNFIGLRSATALYRFFGRNAWGVPVGIAVHDFAADADPDAAEKHWQTWLDGLFD